MTVEPDQVPGLLTAEEQPLAPQRLEHVAVADIGDDDANAAFLHQPVEAEVRHRRHGDALDAEVEREDGEDLVPVDRLAPLVDGEHPVSVAVEGDPDVEAAVADDVGQRAKVGCPAADVDVPSVASPIAVTSAPSCSNACGARPAYAPFAQSTAMRRPLRSVPKRSST